MRIAGQISTERFLAIAAVNGAKANKFGAVAVGEGGDSFDSKHEARVVGELRVLEAGGFIGNLKVDKRELHFCLEVNGVHVCDYVADARFEVVREFALSGVAGTHVLRVGQSVVLDAKSPPTRKRREYGIKRNLMLAVFGVRVLEV